MTIKKAVIISAGGSGQRMQSMLPKQFLPIGGVPVILRTIDRFISALSDIELIVVLNDKWKTLWQEICHKHSFDYPHVVIEGGAQRFHSVKNAIDYLAAEDTGEKLVAIHDAVRPFVSKDVIINTFCEAERHGAAIVALPPIDSMRLRDSSGEWRAIDRQQIMTIQTPQVFLLSLLKKAYNQPFRPDFTDDATVVETVNQQIRLVEGNRENFKITTPSDLLFAEALIRAKFLTPNP